VLSREEWRRAPAIALETVAGRVPVVTGIYAESHAQAADLAREAEREGADALLVFPPNAMLFEGPQEMALERYSAISNAVSIGLVAFIYPAWTRMQVATETLVLRLVQAGEMAAAGKLYGRIQILTAAVYRTPMINMYTRMKEHLVMLSRLDSAHVRTPVTPLSDCERGELRRSLVEAGLLEPAQVA
jgi:dihydrodipicolinate synthase/N-acetylneuraminate lyase